jgi:hypothetical protein
MDLLNNAVVNGPVNVVGQWSLSNGAQLNGFPVLQNAPPIPDTYANVTLPATLPPCDTTQNTAPRNNQPVSLTATGGAVHFCNGINLGNGNTVTLGPGTYYIDQGINFGANDVITGTGVTIIQTDNTAMNMKPNNTMTLTAPTTGPYAGLAWMSLNTDTTVTQSIKNNATLNITGAVYFPHNALDFANNVSQPGGCTQYIGRTVFLKNNANIDDHCAGTGTRPLRMSGGMMLAE